MSEQATSGDPLSFDEFPTPTYQDWHTAALESLGGASFEKSLATPTYEGITLQPIYHRTDTARVTHPRALPGFPPYVRGIRADGYVARPWHIAQEVPSPTPDALNEALRHDLERGQDAINLVLDVHARAGLDPDQDDQAGLEGFSLASLDDLQTAFERIDLTKLPVMIYAGTSALAVTALLAAYMQANGLSPADLQGGVLSDPLGELARIGSLPLPLESAYDEVAQLTTWVRQHAPHLDTMVVSTDVYHEGGCHAVQELAFAIATGVDYLRALHRRHIDIEVAASHIHFQMIIGSQFFMEVAKLRAARLLWAQVIAAFGGSAYAQKMRLHARTAQRNKTDDDPYGNVLRTAMESFAGALGGVESMHVTPFDAAAGLPNEFSRRIARNQQLILQEECSLTHQIDPAGGSWYVEMLTDSLARRAWNLFQEIEQRGGMAEVLRSGYIQAQISEVALQRIAAIEQRKDGLVGINMYPNLVEKPSKTDHQDGESIQETRARQVASYRARSHVGNKANALEKVHTASLGDRMDAALEAARAGATLGEITRSLRDSGGDERPAIVPVNAIRLAESFETLRRNAAAYAARRGSAPRIFLACVGNYQARAEFTTRFFEVGGFEIVNPGGFASADEAAQAALDSDAPVVVICSSDDLYPQIVPPIVSQIKATRPETVVVLAGYPPDQVEAHRAAGVDEFIHLRANCFDINRKLQQRIGVSA